MGVEVAGDGVDVAAGSARAGRAGVRGEGAEVGELVAEVDDDPVADMQAGAGGDHPGEVRRGAAGRILADTRREGRSGTDVVDAVDGEAEAGAGIGVEDPQLALGEEAGDVDI